MTDADPAVDKEAIKQGLAILGLAAGDHVLVHSALAAFGRVEGGAETVIDALLETVGSEGTVVMPTFETPGDVFDPETSETTLGAVPRAFSKRRGVRRSRHPLASVAAMGARAAELVRDHEKAPTGHGPGTPYHRLSEWGGKVLLLGVDQDRSTFLHTPEELARLPYLRPAKGTFIDEDGKPQTRSWRHFPGPHRNFIGLQRWLEEQGLTRKTRIGRCLAQIMPCRDLLAALQQRLEDEPGLFISPNPGLPDAVRQNADILRAKWRRCTFTVAADSAFAGKYADEIIDNLSRCGIDRIVLSYVNEVPWHRIERPRRTWILRGLKQAGLRVAAVRLPVALPDAAPGLLAEAGTDTLIIPSTAEPEAVAALASDRRIVLVENVGIESGALIARIEEWRRAAGRGSIRLAFDPLGFVQVGENPFLKTFHTALRHEIALLYVNDGTATGRRVPLEEGLCEVKELVSILHCRGFDGLFVMQATDSSRFVATARRFMGMLEEVGVLPRDLEA